MDSLEPQFVAVAGVLRAELERRDGSLGDARLAVEAALERVEYCSDDTVRLGRLAPTGLAVEADAAQRARDLGDADEQAAAIARAEIMLSRVRAAAEAGGPIESALQASAEAHILRANSELAVQQWRAAGAAWDGLERPLMAAIARWRAAESALAHGDRETAAQAAATALAAARRLGAAWLVEELEGARRARAAGVGEPAGGAAGRRRPRRPGAPAEDDPFGLTPRERQVLGLVGARGDEPRDRRRALHGREDGQRPRVADPGQARRAQPHRGGGGRPRLGLAEP